MSEYKGIKGFQVQTRTEDPVPYAQALADNPYVGSWGSGGALNTARNQVGNAGADTENALAFGGNIPGGEQKLTESYDGSSWTEVADLNVVRRLIDGIGASNTAALAVGGYGGPPGYQDLVEQWNGSSWTEIAETNSVHGTGGSAGTTTSGLVFGGVPSVTPSALTESWDGSSWTEVGDLNDARIFLGSCGTSNTAALGFGGDTPGVTANTESWNGSSWTEVNNLNTARQQLSGAGNYTAALAFGGYTPGGGQTSTESWDGSSWSEVNALSTARWELGGAGLNNTNAIAFGGDTPGGKSSSTEEWSFSGLDPSTTPAADYADAIAGDFYYNSTTGQFKTVNDGGQPIGTWASASGINTGRSYFAGAGTATSSMVFGGYNAPGPPTGTTEDTEIWNGSSWTEVSNLNEAPYYNMAGSGASSTAALCYAGQGGGVRKNNAESWDGSSWTEITGLNTGRSGAAGVGPQTAAMCFGGNRYNPPPSVQYQAVSEIWNGSSWTETGDLNTARGDIAPVGSVYTDVLAVSGSTGSNTKVNEAFNGSSWTELADTNTTASSRSGSGVPAGPTAIVAGGYAPGVTANTEAWDGSSWTETGDLATARGKSAESASSTTGFQVGGETPSTPKNTNVEQFSFDDFQIKTVTTS